MAAMLAKQVTGKSKPFLFGPLTMERAISRQAWEEKNIFQQAMAPWFQVLFMLNSQTITVIPGVGMTRMQLMKNTCVK